MRPVDLLLLSCLLAVQSSHAVSGGRDVVQSGSLPLRPWSGGENLRPPACQELPSCGGCWGIRQRTGVLVHGCHLQAEGWEEIAWGREETNELGRIPQAVLVAHREGADMVLFGTGGSKSSDGVMEGEYTMRYMFDNFERLKNFREFEEADLARLKETMRLICRSETRSLNTVQELELCGQIMHNEQIQKVILVSSPTHLPRCMRDAKVVFDENKFSFSKSIFACPSNTCYKNSQARDVAIVEPPHRGDRDKEFDKWPLHRYLDKFFKAPRETRLKVLQEMSKNLS